MTYLLYPVKPTHALMGSDSCITNKASSASVPKGEYLLLGRHWQPLWGWGCSRVSNEWCVTTQVCQRVGSVLVGHQEAVWGREEVGGTHHIFTIWTGIHSCWRLSLLPSHGVVSNHSMKLLIAKVIHSVYRNSKSPPISYLCWGLWTLKTPSYY